MLGIEAVTAYLLIVALATLFVAILVWQRHRSQQTVSVWLASGVVGVLLGSIGSYGVLGWAGYRVVQAPAAVPGEAMAGATPASMGGGMGGMPGMGGGMMKGMGGPGGGMMKGMPGMGGGMGGMGGGMGAPRPKRDLATLVQKLSLLTGDVAITLTVDQAATVRDCLKDIEKPAKMTDDEAKAKHDKLLASLDDKQKARLEAIGLPRPARGGGPGGPGGMMGGPGGMMGGPGGMMGGSGGMMGGAPKMGGGAAPKMDEDQNPFQQEAEGKAAKTLRERVAPKVEAPKVEAPKVEAPKVEAPKVEAPKVEAPKSEPPKPPAPKPEAPKAEPPKTPAKK